LTTDAVRTAYAKGLSRRRVLIRHVLRVSLIPIVSLWGLDFAAVIGGATLVVEVVFNLNGIGQYAAQSVRSLDVPPVLVVTLLGAVFVIVMNALVDILYAVLDPRIRVAAS
jgi:peptide/nickel transport system permease protein